jgi:uncharacterized protein YoxC
LERIVATIEQSKPQIEALARDAHELLENVNHVAKEGKERLAQAEEILHTVGDLVEGLKTKVEHPLVAAARGLSRFYLGAGRIWRAFHRAHNDH